MSGLDRIFDDSTFITSRHDPSSLLSAIDIAIDAPTHDRKSCSEMFGWQMATRELRSCGSAAVSAAAIAAFEATTIAVACPPKRFRRGRQNPIVEHGRKLPGQRDAVKDYFLNATDPG
ncbi:hypothetical protein [Rhodopseudomonas palustris]|uniref:hypothetical protein n=1 Tax=Rhodopseudomonas palustris TaxID=1076 RepID=UPI0021F3A8C8|nr:hypothetical protein [Rhodopseudomonas palustris]UYO55686.1 hypothetical protein KQX61_09910 [Rhodopseudomonas palustris]